MSHVKRYYPPLSQQFEGSDVDALVNGEMFERLSMATLNNMSRVRDPNVFRWIDKPGATDATGVFDYYGYRYRVRYEVTRCAQTDALKRVRVEFFEKIGELDWNNEDDDDYAPVLGKDYEHMDAMSDPNFASW